jgi:KDO2-lipid IV(A) lauroyltransferase
MNTTLKWYQKACLESLWASLFLLSHTPRFFKYYMLKPFLASILILVGYRRKVITRNLTNSFPDKTPAAIKDLCRSNYLFLAEVIVDTISMVGASEERKRKAVNWTNRKEINDKLDGKDWIAIGAHYGCWEYLPLWSMMQKSNTFMSVYHPLKSIVFEYFYQRIRKVSDNIVQIPMRNAIPYYLKNRNKGMILGLLSDQSPALYQNSHWYRFLNQDTVFIDGAEIIAMKYKLPIYFAHTTRLAPGRYNVRLVELYDGQEEVATHEITNRYINMLESMINECPELWMWSHNRWKHTPEKQIRLFGKSTLHNQN